MVSRLSEKLLPQPEVDLGWKWIFFANVFFGCIAFSIVMPNLWLYLESMHASTAFYAFVVASFSTGEAVGAIAIGALSNHIGTKRSLILCSCLGITGATSYALAFTIYRYTSHVVPLLGPCVVLGGRLLQGIGAGGRQAVEQAYFSVAAPPEKLTELTSMLSTFACLGFIFGPMFGAAAGLIPAFHIGDVLFDTYTLGGWLCALLDLGIMTNLWLRFTETKLQTKPGAELEAARGMEEGGKAKARRPRVIGVWACIAFFFVHFNGFALQETITTPLVQAWFGWSEMRANLLFTGAGVANFLCSGLMTWLSASVTLASGLPGAQRVSDRALLASSMVLGAVGWLLMIPTAGPMGVPQFLLAFTLVTVAFPFGRGVCLAMVGRILGDQPQGAWMGVMFALGSVARIVGPFWAVEGFLLGPLAVFGGTGLLFLLALGAMWLLWTELKVQGADQFSLFEASPMRRGSTSGMSSPASLHVVNSSPRGSPPSWRL